MEVPWPDNRCILCLHSGPLTSEHIIPKALGGCLRVKFLCKKCNDEIGARVEADVKRDPSIRLAIENLSGQIPELAKALSEGQIYLGESKRGPVRGKVKRGVFRVMASKETDNSLIQPTEDARKTLENLLQEIFPDEASVPSALERFDEAAEDTRIKIAEGIEVIKWSIGAVHPALDGPMIEDTLPLKVSFEYLACHLGATIYDDRLNDIRNSLLNQQASPDCYRVERLRGTVYAPFHGIVIEENAPHVIVQIRLFGWLVYRVHFLRIALDGPRFVYTLDLKGPTEHLSRVA